MRGGCYVSTEKKNCDTEEKRQQQAGAYVISFLCFAITYVLSASLCTHKPPYQLYPVAWDSRRIPLVQRMSLEHGDQTKVTQLYL